MQGMKIAWKIKANGGSWDIVSHRGDVIACEIPFGTYAEYIVELHNQELIRKREMNVCPQCPHRIEEHDANGCGVEVLIDLICKCTKPREEESA